MITFFIFLIAFIIGTLAKGVLFGIVCGLAAVIHFVALAGYLGGYPNKPNR